MSTTAPLPAPDDEFTRRFDAAMAKADAGIERLVKSRQRKKTVRLESPQDVVPPPERCKKTRMAFLVIAEEQLESCDELRRQQDEVEEKINGHDKPPTKSTSWIGRLFSG
jgi:hypothetical protein